MSAISITRTHTIDAGHRVYKHGGKCANLHGHRYKFEFTLGGTALNELGMVVDFSEIKSRLCGWLDNNWDHKTLLYNMDPIGAILIRDARQWHDSNAVVLLSVNPTAENLVIYFAELVAPRLLRDTGVELIACTVWETDKCCATWMKNSFKDLIEAQKLGD